MEPGKAIKYLDQISLILIQSKLFFKSKYKILAIMKNNHKTNIIAGKYFNLYHLSLVLVQRDTPNWTINIKDKALTIIRITRSIKYVCSLE